MTVPQPLAVGAADFDSGIPELPNTDAAFLVWAGAQSAYLAKTGMLRRRLQRILKPGAPTGRMLNLRSVATKVEYWLTGSRFESALVYYALAKRHYPGKYLEMVKLRMPAYVRVTLDNPFPRTQVTTRFGSGQALYYGPFRSRGGAEHFEAQMLDLFQVRRCHEDLAPAPDHPGCIYGEMSKCLRPCQQIVSPEEYASEVNRMTDFLIDRGAAMLIRIGTARDRLSEEMDFEQAARQHKLLEQAQQVIDARDALATSIEQLNGVAVVTSSTSDSVRLWFMYQGCWQEPADLALTSHVSLDRRLREAVGRLQPVLVQQQDRREHLALLARWFYSTWRDGEWLGFDRLDSVPYRKLVRAVSRVHGANYTRE